MWDAVRLSEKKDFRADHRRRIARGGGYGRCIMSDEKWKRPRQMASIQGHLFSIDLLFTFFLSSQRHCSPLLSSAYCLPL